MKALKWFTGFFSLCAAFLWINKGAASVRGPQPDPREQLLWWGLLLVLICGYAVSDAIMDAIKDYRTHIAKHPYRDFWHLMKHVGRACFFFASGVFFEQFGVQTVLLSIVGVGMGGAVWDIVYGMPATWMRLDESIHISTHWAWLDKKLGFHW